MVRVVGEPYNQIFLLANNGPNFLLHATLSSASLRDEKREESDAATALTLARVLLLAVVNAQNTLFHLGLEEQIEQCKKDVREAMDKSLTANQALG
jgi:hypothetical protein